MKQTRKIAITILMILVITMICTISQAIDVYREDAQGMIQGGHFFPNENLGGGVWFCIQPGGEFHVSSLMTKAENARYPVGTTIPSNGDYECVVCVPTLTLPWSNGSKYYYKYEEGEKFDFYQYQDAAYVLAELSEQGKLLSWDAAYGIWNSRLSNPKRIGDYSIIEESKAYDAFFELIHGGRTSNDIFESLIKDNSKDIYKGVKQEEGSYVIGPFNIDYPIGVYDGKNKFSWIEEIKALTNVGELGVTILSETKEEISIDDLKENGTKTLENQNFYVKFYSTTATEAVVKIKFGYLEHCEATMTEYTGKRIYRNWKYETDGTHDHPTEHPEEKDAEGNVTKEAWTEHDYKTKRRYKAIDVEGSATQRLMALSGEAKKVKKTVEKYFPIDKPVDLTMELAGNVFLDADQGKANEGDNKITPGQEEGLKGIEVTLYESNGKLADAEHTVMHVHTGDATKGTGCYTVPVYHTHLGSETAYGQCYSELVHEHTGSKEYGTGCYELVYHQHTLDCYAVLTCTSTDESHVHNLGCYTDSTNDITLNCTDETEGHNHNLGCYSPVTVTCKEVHTHTINCCANKDKITLICKHSTDDPDGYRVICGNEETYKKTCTKVSVGEATEETPATIDYYKPGCNKTIGSADGTRAQVAKTHTDANGNYKFENLNAQKRYYVEFVYNGVLYTNVERLEGNATDISKATEEAQGHTGNRQAFNNVFKEIGSNPKNYKSPSREGYNQVFLQEDIADTFTTIANKFGQHGTTDKEVFAYDCRIKAYTTETYPLNKQFTIDAKNHKLAAEDFDALYSGKYDQLHVNLGIKARQTFDLALYKDVMKATLNINGQTEVYTYDARKDWTGKGFSYGVAEDHYLNAIRDKYMKNTDTGDLQKATEGTSDQYRHEYRTEEIINGNNTNEEYRDWLGEDEYLETLFGEGKDNNYSWRDINSGLKDEEKLNIEVTYKIAIQNQSSILGSVTEIVDYYDNNYIFVGAYVGDEDGNKIEGTEVDARVSNSKYGTEDEIRADRNDKDKVWKVSKEQVESGTRGYETVYLRPTEKILYNGNVGDTEQYIFVTYRLKDPERTLIEAGLPWGKTFYTYNLAEINGYKTYISESEYKNDPKHKDGDNYKDPVIFREEIEATTEGLIDRDSIPGNFNPAQYTMGETKLEDDTNKAPAYAYSIRKSRTIEGQVFEDMLSEEATVSKDRYGNAVKYMVDVAKTRFGDGTINVAQNKDKGIAGVKVELIEIKNGELIVRAQTKTDQNGWYGFGAFIPGQYTIRFTYGADNDTALTSESQYEKGLNDTSYNGQDYQATTFGNASDNDRTLSLNTQSYNTDSTLIQKYNDDNNIARQNGENEKINEAPKYTLIRKYQKLESVGNGEFKEEPYYWFETGLQGKSDAMDDTARRKQVTEYAKSEYNREIVNHKANVFNSYINQETLRQQEAEARQPNFNKDLQAQPLKEELSTEEKNKALVNELERRNYMFAYTPEINIEVEKAKTEVTGNQNSDYYEYEIRGVDFGVVERPRAQLTIDQDIAKVKVTATDGRTLLELENDGNGNIGVIVDNGNNYQWLNTARIGEYDKNELLNIILDDELLNGAKLEVTYNITVTNNSESGIGKTGAKNIVNYVANNLNFDLEDNQLDGKQLWKVVKKEDIQTGDIPRQPYDAHSTWINSEEVNEHGKLIDLSTQTTVLMATDNNPLTQLLAPKESRTTTLTLKKTLSAESSGTDDLSYSNLTEIVEIDNEVGRYDHGAIPGNQSLEEQPREHDTSGASRYDDITNDGKKQPYDPDGKIIITPPTGQNQVYYVLGTTVGVILLIGIALIKKFVIDPKKNKE